MLDNIMCFFRVKIGEMLQKKPSTTFTFFILFFVSLSLSIYIIQNSFLWGYDPFHYVGLAKLIVTGQNSSWAYPQGTMLTTFADRLPFSGLVFFSLWVEAIFRIPAIIFSRYIMALIAAVGVGALFLFVKKIIDYPTGLLTALFLAVSPFYLGYSTTLYPDILFFFLSMVCLYFFISKSNVGFLSSYIVGTLIFILAFLTRPYAFLLLPSILLALFLEKERRLRRRGLLCVFLGILVAVFIIFFRSYLNTGNSLDVNLLYTRFSLLDQISLFNWQLLYHSIFETIPEQISTIFFILGTLGMAVSLLYKKIRMRTLPIIIYVFSYIFYVVLFYSPYTRYTTLDPNMQAVLTDLPVRVLIPLYGFILLFAGFFLVLLVKFLLNYSINFRLRRFTLSIKLGNDKFIKCFFTVIFILFLLMLLIPRFNEATTLVNDTTQYEDRYWQLASWIDSNLNENETILVSYSWRIWCLTDPTLQRTLWDIANTPSNLTDFLSFLTQPNITYVVYDPQWVASKIRFDSMNQDLINDIFEPVFSYREVGPPLIVYKNLLANHSLMESHFDFENDSILHLTYLSQNGSLQCGAAKGIDVGNTTGLYLNHTAGVVTAYLEQCEWVVSSREKGFRSFVPVIPNAVHRLNLSLCEEIEFEV